MKPIFLTFDVEDFINPVSMATLIQILGMLNDFHLKAIFFVTGHMAEELQEHPDIVNSLRKHEIGYHSSNHSVRPIIAEYTDLKSFDQAEQESYERETSHIDPVTGFVAGEGGIEAVRSLFSKKKIVIFRAPGLSWSPPHMMALTQLGIRYDFSLQIPSTHFILNKITFCPSKTIFVDEFLTDQTVPALIRNLRNLSNRLIKNEGLTLVIHPHKYAIHDSWDKLYFRGNPKCLSLSEPRRIYARVKALFALQVLLFELSLLGRSGALQITPSLLIGQQGPKLTAKDVQQIYRDSLYWPQRFFGYNPRYLKEHFDLYFGENI